MGSNQGRLKWIQVKGSFKRFQGQGSSRHVANVSKFKVCFEGVQGHDTFQRGSRSRDISKWIHGQAFIRWIHGHAKDQMVQVQISLVHTIGHSTEFQAFIVCSMVF